MTRKSDGDGDDEALHVFDQSNGVLGQNEDDAPEPKRTTIPPRSFGVPPITSL